MKLKEKMDVLSNVFQHEVADGENNHHHHMSYCGTGDKLQGVVDENYNLINILNNKKECLFNSLCIHCSSLEKNSHK